MGASRSLRDLTQGSAVYRSSKRSYGLVKFFHPLTHITLIAHEGQCCRAGVNNEIPWPSPVVETGGQPIPGTLHFGATEAWAVERGASL